MFIRQMNVSVSLTEVTFLDEAAVRAQIHAPRFAYITLKNSLWKMRQHVIYSRALRPTLLLLSHHCILCGRP
jgi:hypothetical protein